MRNDKHFTLDLAHTFFVVINLRSAQKKSIWFVLAEKKIFFFCPSLDNESKSIFSAQFPLQYFVVILCAKIYSLLAQSNL